jgi:hypothetical protein
MSGGEFGYAYGRVEYFCELLTDKINNKEYAFSEETSSLLEDILDGVEIAGELMKEVEWLYSGDTGEDSFQENIEEILAKYDNS